MNQGEGFYVTLPSNASKDVFPNNTISSFTVDLAKPIELDGQWMVGLCEIIYPRTWYIVPQEDAFIQIDDQLHTSASYTSIGSYSNNNSTLYTVPQDDPHTHMNKLKDDPYTFQVIGKGGYFYDRPRDLADQLGPVLRKYDSTASVSFNNVTKHFEFKGSGQYKIRTHAPLSYVMGMKNEEWWTLSNRMAPYPVDLNAGIYNLFVYSDLIHFQQVGDSYAPLLRVVDVKGSFGDVVNIRYHTVHYLPVSKGYIKSIQVEIKSDRNRCIDFVYGKTMLKLHFKPVL